MSTFLERFQIKGLHGRSRSITIPIQDNQLVLVGENGTGKSTVANLIYYTLSQQWRRISEYRFEEINVEAAGEIVRLTHDDVVMLENVQSLQFSRNELRHYPPHIARNIYRAMAEEALMFEGAPDSPAIERISEVARIPRAMAQRLYMDYIESKGSKLKKPLLQEIKKMESWKFGQFLYLPTYRRIEQDLKSIFRGIEIEEKVREFRERFRKRDRSTYIELIEFGMEDVERTIQARMAQIKESVRTGLSTLTGTYLREVIRGFQANPDLTALREIDLQGFQSMFARIDEATLPAADKILLQTKINEISRSYQVGPDDKVIAHFLSKLVALYREQQASESDVRDFIRLCNDYLTGKQFVYDDINYEIYIQQGERSAPIGPPEKLSLKVLSSGEKQIVSLFSHIYFSGEAKFFVIIDEPELSLSVPWQQRFLPDIMRTNRCTGIVAVTHSPFIWENSLESYVKPLADCVKEG